MRTTYKLLARILFDIGVIFSIVFLSWWVSVLMMLLGGLLFRAYHEVVVAGIIFDILYRSGPDTATFSVPYATILSMVYYMILSILRTKLR